MNLATQNQETIKQLRADMAAGRLTYDQAKALAQPVIDAANEQAKLIAKKHGRRPQKVTFSYLLRAL